MAALEDHAALRLNISGEVRKILEERAILPEDLRPVIHFAETTGYKLFNPKTGRFLAHYKSGAVTFWAEYSRAGDGFEIHTAYSHRMEILEGLEP
ncbi:MAG: hypothetical protein AB1896_11440 [Thermodesulfobacteriota bacterium]